jgi:hypothetical protein
MLKEEILDDSEDPDMECPEEAMLLKLEDDKAEAKAGSIARRLS